MDFTDRPFRPRKCQLGNQQQIIQWQQFLLEVRMDGFYALLFITRNFLQIITTE